MTAEARAALHSDQCAPACAACLARDLQAKGDAVREECARIAEREARRFGTAAACKRLGDSIRRGATAIGETRRAA
jgi:hypothetical protein